MENNASPRLNQLYYPKFLAMMLLVLATTAAASVYFSLNWGEMEPSGQTLLMVVYGGGGLLSLVLTIRLLICRVRIDENGVDVDNPFSGNTMLNWGDIRTAAIVRIRVSGRTSDPMIILATREPEIVLTKHGVSSGKVIGKHEHVRIPLNPARRATIEHYLHMTLPEYTI
nr:PH domain-containing protein [Clostridia bacterium]